MAYHWHNTPHIVTLFFYQRPADRKNIALSYETAHCLVTLTIIKGSYLGPTPIRCPLSDPPALCNFYPVRFVDHLTGIGESIAPG